MVASVSEAAALCAATAACACACSADTAPLQAASSVARVARHASNAVRASRIALLVAVAPSGISGGAVKLHCAGSADVWARAGAAMTKSAAVAPSRIFIVIVSCPERVVLSLKRGICEPITAKMR
jgi:hypothetical protein